MAAVADAPSRAQLYQWFHMYTSSPSLSLSPMNLRKTIYILRTHPDIAQSSPQALATFIFSLGQRFGDLVKCAAALSDLSDVLGRLLELKGDSVCKKLLKSGYVNQMEQVTHHRIKNEKMRRAFERKKQSSSSWFVSNRLEEQRREKKEQVRALFEAPDDPLPLRDEDDEIQKKICLALFESPFQALDFADCLQIESQEVARESESREEKPKLLPVATVHVPEALSTPRPVTDPRIYRRIQSAGIADILACEEIRRDLPRLSLVLDLNGTLAEAMDRDKIATLKVLIPSSALVLKSCEGDCFLIPRPGLQAFLSRLARFCDLTLHVSALSAHCAAVAKALDPEGRLLRTCESPDACVTAVDMDQTVVFSARASLWDDGHLLQSLPFSVSQSERESEFRLSALREALYGAKDLTLPWADDRDESELADVASALEGVYTQFLTNRGAKTFASELLQYRAAVLADLKLSFAVYEKSLGEPDYTGEKLSLYRFAARHLGATEASGGVEVAEYTSEEKKFVAGSWLLKCFFRLCKVPL